MKLLITESKLKTDLNHSKDYKLYKEAWKNLFIVKILMN